MPPSATALMLHLERGGRSRRAECGGKSRTSRASGWWCDTHGVTEHVRTPFDVGAYVERVRANADPDRCFICAIARGEREEPFVVLRDEICIGFLAKDPTLLGCCLVAPVDHRTGVVDDFTESEYVALQQRVYRIGWAVSQVVPRERLYILSLGSKQATAHVHWHVAPLPAGVAYEQQQYAALMHENGYLQIPDDEQRRLAERIRRELG